MKHIPVRDILWLFVATRLLLLLITYVMYILLTAKNYTSTPVDSVAFFTSWNHWDAINYTSIAQHGYQNTYDLAFFPLFPFLVACISQVLGSWSYILAGTIVSNAALFGALVIIYHLIAKQRRQWTDSEDHYSEVSNGALAHRTLLYLCVFPTAFFFFAAYNESLYLLLASGTFLALEHERWWLAGLLGLLAALTRSIGIFLLIPYLYELWQRRERTLTHLPAILKSLLPCLLIPLGTAIYALYCWQTFGSPLAFAVVQAHWGRQTTWPWVGILQEVSALFANPFGSTNEATIILNLSATFGFIFLIIAGWHKLPKSYSLWMTICLIFILTSPAMIKPDVLLSNQRFVLELFPAFITLAQLTEKRPRTHYASVFTSATLLAILSTAFIMNRWIV